MDKKRKIINRKLKRIKTLARVLYSFKLDNYALDVLSGLGTLMYEWNQSYTDDEIENMLYAISKRNIKPEYLQEQNSKNTVLFYDSFGYDNRGLALIYLKSLCELGYKVIYLFPEGKEQPVLRNALKHFDIMWEAIQLKNNLKKSKQISGHFDKYKPSTAFLYAHPADTSAIIVFNAYQGIAKRFQINLTDHAFWLGLKSFDYCVEFRNFGASVSFQFRSISKSKLILLPYYPYVDKSIAFEGFSKKFHGRKIIFSGGSIPKTLGDENLLYYKMVRRILDVNKDVAFVYAGSGPDTSEMDKLIEEYNDRAERISERKDLYQVLRHSFCFLNTFPDCGGLMTQYSAVAGKLPITLYEGENDLRGLINNREMLRVEFTDIDSIANEIRHLLSDELYLTSKESYLKDAVISEDKFVRELQLVVEQTRSTYPLKINEFIDRKTILEDYNRGFNYDSRFLMAISYHKILSVIFPSYFFRIVFKKCRVLLNK